MLPRVDSLTEQELGCTFGALVDAEDRAATAIISLGTPPDLFRGRPMVIVMSSETSNSDETSEGIDIAMEHVPSIVFLRNGGATYYHLDHESGA